jgi:zinc D-Ala-D-Ala carboxypeptidase
VLVSPINYLLGLGVPWASEGADTVAGLSRANADEVYRVVTKTQALPTTYAPKDVVRASSNGIPAYAQIDIRKIIVPDAREMANAASAEGIRLQVISGYRSYAVQQQVFAMWTRKDGSPEEANRYSALPGHSQHQLGTALDLNSFGETFSTTPVGRWLWSNAYRFGFVFPYTVDSAPTTGYEYEPWHVRWVGRELAQIMETAGYRESAVFTVDAIVVAVREVARLPGATAVIRRIPQVPSGFPAFRVSGPRVS